MNNGAASTHLCVASCSEIELIGWVVEWMSFEDGLEGGMS